MAATRVISRTKTAFEACRYLVTEAGFGADFLACREKIHELQSAAKAGLAPDAVVIVATERAMKMNGGVAKGRSWGRARYVRRLEAGCANLGRHIKDVKSFGVPVVVGINHFAGEPRRSPNGGPSGRTTSPRRDLGDPVQALGAGRRRIGGPAHRGGGGLPLLAHRAFSTLYPDEMPLFSQKIEGTVGPARSITPPRVVGGQGRSTIS